MRLVVGCWWLVVGCWLLLVVGCGLWVVIGWFAASHPRPDGSPLQGSVTHGTPTQGAAVLVGARLCAIPQAGTALDRHGLPMGPSEYV